MYSLKAICYFSYRRFSLTNVLNNVSFLSIRTPRPPRSYGCGPSSWTSFLRSHSTSSIFSRHFHDAKSKTKINCLPINDDKPLINEDGLHKRLLTLELEVSGDTSVLVLKEKLLEMTGYASRSIELFYTDAPVSSLERIQRARQAILAGKVSSISSREKLLEVCRRVGFDCVGIFLFMSEFALETPTPLPTPTPPPSIVYRKPKSLTTSPGYAWDFQPSNEVIELIAPKLALHYLHHQMGWMDKSAVPMYSFVSAPGTGKSRNATEFPNYLKAATKDPILKARLEKARVFHIGFENGTSYKRELEHDPDKIIAARMMNQLIGHGSLREIILDDEIPDVISLLKTIAKQDGFEYKDSTAILIVDGIHNLVERDGNPDSATQLLRALSDISLSDAFISVCITATLFAPLQDFHRVSRQMIVDLPVQPILKPTINTIPVFDTSNPFVDLLLSDSGGHGRVLESIYTLLWGRPENKDRLTLTLDRGANLEAFMALVREDIRSKYGEVWLNRDDVVGILAAVLGHRRFHISERIPNTGLTVERLISRGMFWFKREIGSETGVIQAPYIWIHILLRGIPADGERGPRLHATLRNLQMSDYNQIFKPVDGHLMMDPPSTEAFERLVVLYRCLKSIVFEDGQLINIQEVYAGAKMTGTLQFVNRRLEPAKLPSKHSTKSSENTFESSKLFLNAQLAPAGDFVTTLESLEGPVNEVGQCKLYSQSTPLTQGLYEKEAEKSVVRGVDFFILFTPKRVNNITLGPREGLVDGDCWEDFFGIFYGRAHKMYPLLTKL